jgi:hypothetical protein
METKMAILNATRLKKFVLDEGIYCPICKTGELDNDDDVFSFLPDTEVSVTLVCQDCGAEVFETYVLKSVEVDRNTERQYRRLNA